jgi:hypothetical protein
MFSQTVDHFSMIVDGDPRCGGDPFCVGGDPLTTAIGGDPRA